MMNTQVSALNHTMNETHEWLEQLVGNGPYDNEQQAYSHLRAVLHSLRDRLTVEEATHLAAQLPMLIRGFYYEGWRPSLAPNPERDPHEFFDSVRESLKGAEPPSDEEITPSVRAVFALLTDRLAEGQIRHVRGQMPAEMQALWGA